MSRNDAMKAILKNSLQAGRSDLLWKLEGLSERDLRLSQTPTGSNLLGAVKHMANVEVGYFGETFGRSWPQPEELVSLDQIATDPQADWYATSAESAEHILGLYRRVWTFADETIDQLDLDAQGTVPHWPGERATVGHHVRRTNLEGQTISWDPHGRKQLSIIVSARTATNPAG